MVNAMECLDSLIKVFEHGVESDGVERNLITHYTKYDSGIKILCNKTLWATDHRYLNDPLEISYGVEKIMGWVKEYKQNIPQLEALLQMIEDKQQKDHYHMLITSLVKHSDYLPCWRYYGGDGTGISISFDKNKLKEGFEQRGIHSQMSDVIYDVQDQKRLVENLISTYVENEFQSPECLVILLFMCLPVLKHHDWKDELEFRLISPHIFMECDSRFIFRDLPTNKIASDAPKLQYKLFEFDYDEINRVTVGPCANYDLAKNRIYAQLRASGLSEAPFDIVQSQKKYSN